MINYDKARIISNPNSSKVRVKPNNGSWHTIEKRGLPSPIRKRIK